jgi:hypothetical protein
MNWVAEKVGPKIIHRSPQWLDGKCVDLDYCVGCWMDVDILIGWGHGRIGICQFAAFLRILDGKMCEV